MVTYINKNTHGKYAGNSSEEKPLEVQNGSVFFEIDTGLYYMYDAENKVWYEQKDNGGGGGSYTLPVATESTLGGIKAPAKTPDQTVPVGIGEDNKLYVAPSGEEQVQSDWAENDPQSPAYIKNRFGGYDKITENYYIPETTLNFIDGYSPVTFSVKPIVGQNINVKWDNMIYVVTVSQDGEGVWFGNPILAGISSEDNGMPFGFVFGDGFEDCIAKDSGSHTFSIYIKDHESVKIDPKYLPDLPIPPDPLPPITPDDESAFLQVTGGKAVWNKLINRAEVGG